MFDHDRQFLAECRVLLGEADQRRVEAGGRGEDPLGIGAGLGRLGGAPLAHQRAQQLDPAREQSLFGSPFLTLGRKQVQPHR